MSYDSFHQQIQGFLFNGSLYICHEKHARHGNCGFDIFGKHSFREGSTAKRQKKKTLLTQYLCKGVMHAIYRRGKYVFFVCYVISYKKCSAQNVCMGEQLMIFSSPSSNIQFCEIWGDSLYVYRHFCPTFHLNPIINTPL